MSVVKDVPGQRMAMDGRLQTTTPPKRPTAALAAAASTAVAQKPALETVNAEVERLQAEFSNNLGRKVQFNVNQELGRVVVKIVDPSTDQVIKEIPSADVQKLHINMKHISALLVDERI